MLKKIAAFALTAVLAVAMFTGCGKNYESVVTIDGVSITAGEYLYAQFQAYTAAQQKVEDGKNLLKETIDEMSAEEWIHQQTIKNLRMHVWAEKKYDEMGLTLSQQSSDYANQNAEMYWSILGEQYIDNGIGLETYKKFSINNIKSNEIFATLYGENGEKAPSNDEYNKYISENFARVNGFAVSKLDKDGKLVEEDTLIKISNLCDEAIIRLNNGEDFEVVRIDTMSHANKLAGMEDKDFSDATVNTTDFYVPKQSQELSQEFIANVYALQENGQFAYDEVGNELIVYKRVPNYTSDEELNQLKAASLKDMKGEEFIKTVEDESSKFEVVEDNSAVKYYSVSKIK